MTGKLNGRLLMALLAGVAVLLIIAGVLLLSDCSSDEWISSGGTANGDYDASFIGTDSSDAVSGVYAAPAFCSGTYTMLSTVSTSEDYTDGNGKVIYSYSSTTKYTYQLDITVDDNGIVCKYTFVNIYGAVNDNGTLTIDVNTTDPSNYSDSVAAFYDLLGQSFIVTADASGNILSLDGVSEIVAAYPDTESLLDTSTLLSMAGDLFYVMPSTFTDGTTWTVNAYGVKNTYALSKLRGGRFGVDISSEDYELPDPYTDSYGYTTAYTAFSPLTGTLWIDQNDRAVQELTTCQHSEGTYADSDGYGMYFDVTSTNSCVITSA